MCVQSPDGAAHRVGNRLESHAFSPFTMDFQSTWLTLKPQLIHHIHHNITLYLTHKSPLEPSPFPKEDDEGELAERFGPVDVIGGRTLPGLVTEQEAAFLEARILHLLDGFPTYVLPLPCSPLLMSANFHFLFGSVCRHPPFTIQRLCEIVQHPQTIHSTLGKHMRAIERTLLVTSPYEPSPLAPSSSSSSSSSTAAPLFSAITFLPPTPTPTPPLAMSPSSSIVEPTVVEPDELRVDELDGGVILGSSDPSAANPHFLAAHPVALTATTTDLPSAPEHEGPLREREEDGEEERKVKTKADDRFERSASPTPDPVRLVLTEGSEV